MEPKGGGGGAIDAGNAADPQLDSNQKDESFQHQDNCTKPLKCGKLGKVTESIGKLGSGGPGRTRTCNQSVMSGSKSIGFIDFAVFSFAFDCVCCALLVRNWCGAHLAVGLNELQPYPNAGRQVKGAHAEGAACANRRFPNLLAWPERVPLPACRASIASITVFRARASVVMTAHRMASSTRKYS
jgi:hypothetical protein